MGTINKELKEELDFYRRCARERGIDPNEYIERIGMAQMAWAFHEQGISILKIEQLTGIPAAELRDILRFDVSAGRKSPFRAGRKSPILAG